MTQQLEKLTCPRLPLAVYREVAAHLQQTEGVSVEILPAPAGDFDYLQSQVGGLLVSYPAGLSEASEQRLAAILAYYCDRSDTAWIREPR